MGYTGHQCPLYLERRWLLKTEDGPTGDREHAIIDVSLGVIGDLGLLRWTSAKMLDHVVIV